MKRYFKKYFQTHTCHILTAGLTVLFLFVVFVPSVSHGAPITTDVGANATTLLNIGSLGTIYSIDKVIVFILYQIISWVAAFLALAGIVLDKVIQYSIVDLAKNVNDINGINIAWKVIRDLANISFIFVLVYHGIMTIFGKSEAKKIIVSVIIAALLINFSLFFTKLIIDASNIVAVAFYTSVSSAGSSQFTVPLTTTTVNPGMSVALMNSLGLATVFDPSTLGSVVLHQTNIAFETKLIFISLFMTIALFVFISMMILFFVRFLSFIVLMVLSPFAYVASVIPAFKDIKDKYWNTLLGQAYFAPLFMIMIWITLTVAQSFKLTGTLDQSLTNPSVGTLDGLLRYLLVIGMLIYSMIVAKNFARKGGLGTGLVIEKGMSFVGGAVFGGAAAAGRNTLGRFGKSETNNEELKARAARGDRFAQARLNLGGRLAKGSFDTRKSVIGEQIQKATGSFGTGLPFMAKVGQGGFEQKVKDKLEREKKYAESLKPSDEAVAEAKVKLTDTEFVAQEKKKMNDELEKTQATYDAKKTAAETEKTNAEADKTNAEKIKEKLTRENKAFDVELERLEREKLSQKNDAARSVIEEEIKAKERLKSATEGDLKTATEVSNRKVELFKATEEKIREIEKARKIERETVMSEELRNVIAIAGGSKANEKILKNTFDLDIPDDAIDSAKDERMKAYAENLEKPNMVREWLGAESATKINRAAAIKIRKDMKGKSLNDLIAEAAKKEAKEAEEAEEKKTPEPAPTPTPTPSAGGTPTP